MKYFILLFFVLNFAFAQTINQFDEQGLRHGVWKGVFEESKRKRYEGTFEHGKEIGVFKYYDDTKVGSLLATREFDAASNSCYTIFYNQKGNKVSEGKLVNKKNEGEWKYYHKDSPKIMTLENYKNGLLDGERKVYYPNGKLAESENYLLGKKDGMYKKYAENEVVLEEVFYKNGLNEGNAIYRDGNNKIVAKGIYKNGKKSGIWEIEEKGKMVKRNMDLQGKKFVKRPKTKEPY